MALVDSLNFLPSPFKTDTNQRFLGATFDHLVSDSANIPLNGYIGRKFAPTYKLGDNYVPEFTTDRQNYQLEPSVVVKDDSNKITFTSDYLDLLQSISSNGGFNTNHRRLFKSDSYNYDGHFDYDKFVNYHQYYWMPNGPESVDVTSGGAPTNDTFNVTRNTAVDGYVFSGLGGNPNVQITLARGGTYIFRVNQPGFKFWIQTKPGATGKDPAIPLLTTREVFGITNNGADTGDIVFRVPYANAQQFYVDMPIVATVSAAVSDITYDTMQGRTVDAFFDQYPEGLDGVTQLQGKTFIFVNNLWDDLQWTRDNVTVPYDQRRGVWQVNLKPNPVLNGSPIIQLLPLTPVDKLQKVFIGSGKTYASQQFWVNETYDYMITPQITSVSDYLYYQDESNPDFYGQIKLIDTVTTPINVNSDILNKKNYTSPNGVVFTNGIKVKFDTLVVPVDYANKEYYVDGVGDSISLISVDQLSVPGQFSTQIESTPDYITINRASADLNPWSRTNRWFHVDVLSATAKYNRTAINYGPNIPGRRAIIEFESNIQLYNYGNQAKRNVDTITFAATAAFTDIEGQISYTVEGVELVEGTRVIFANDRDYDVTNKVWTVSYTTINSKLFLRLLPTDEAVELKNNINILGGTYANQTFWFNGTTWTTSQVKTGFNQTPMFDLVDANGYSFGDTTVYPGSNFTGTKFFGYAVSNTGVNDPILGFKLTYKNFNNIGDIVFKNFYDQDKFTYTSDNETVTVNCNSGYLLKTKNSVSTKLNNWVKSVEKTQPYQIITGFYQDYVLALNGKNYPFIQIDVLPSKVGTVPHLKVYINNLILNPNTDYQVVPYGVYTIITFNRPLTKGDKIDVLVLSDSVSKFGYYDIPDNLDFNPLNDNFNDITLGQLRTHYSRLIENTSFSPTDTIPVRDRYLKAQGGTLMQHSSPLVYAMSFLSNQDVNFIESIDLARKEYAKFKNKFLSLCTSLTNINYNDPKTGVDTILQTINAVKNSSFSWYYSDMVPYGVKHDDITYTVLNVRQKDYEITSIFDNTKLSNRAILVYHNNVQLTLGKDYTFSKISPLIHFNISLTFGDTIIIQDYYDTDGNYIPETPTKLGLYPKFAPKIYVDNSYIEPTTVLRGHDGSLTPVFGDFRDQYLLELELRIFNNIKTNYNKNKINVWDSIPGRFRKTDYSLNEWNQLLTKNFLQWVGTNNIDYISNKWYDPGNKFTWNYSKFTDSVDGSFLQGHWRAIFNYWYDTDKPNLMPWEMLGLAEEPDWWQTRYGPSPYTNGNLTMWEDISRGYIWNNGNPYIDSNFIRPGLLNIIPVDSAGNLMDPDSIGLIKSMNTKSSSEMFAVGQQGPVETAWRRSSDFPFALQTAVALARPADYFATQIDNSRFYTNTVTGQFSDSTNRKINPRLLTINGNITAAGSIQRTSGYINWISDYQKKLGVNPVSVKESFINRINVQLTYRVSGYTDKNLLVVSAEQTTPNSINSSIIIPNESYQIHLGKPVPIKSVTYSAVVVTKTRSGYSVTGYDTTHPYFTILPSKPDNDTQTIAVNDISVKLYNNSTETPIVIPYGTEFLTVQQLADFVYSYGRFLESEGFVFESFDTDLGATKNWVLSVRELVFWAQQGWAPGTLIVLNPVANILYLKTRGMVVNEITNTSNGGRLLNTNFNPIKSNHFNIVRQHKAISPPGSTTKISIVDNIQTIGCAKLFLVQHEHKLIFDNVDSFGDIIYVPNQGTRQYRLKLNGAKTGAWDGGLSPTGYIYNDPNIESWRESTDYRQGDIVVYNDSYYVAPTDIPAATSFSVTSWTEVIESSIKTGLLPSFGHNAQVFEQIYDIDYPPDDKTLEAFSAGLLGFRERPFLSNLGMTVSTQAKFYQGYIKQKGSMNAVSALTKAKFDNITSDIDTYEEWAFEVGQYGDIDNNLYNEFVLDQSIFRTNPVALRYSADAYSTANIIVNLNSGNIYKSGNLLTTSSSLYKNQLTASNPSDLPTAGYVNLNDIDYAIFDLNQVRVIPKIYVGTKIWTAKARNNIWNVYRTTETKTVATEIKYNSGLFATLSFSMPHNLEVNDFFVMQGFNINYNGVYKVVKVVNNLSITIQLTEEAKTKLVAAQASVTGRGKIYKMVSIVVDSVGNIETVRPPNDYIENDRIWVNNATINGWGVYEFKNVWQANTSTKLTANTVTSNNRFGSATAISRDRKYLYVSNPGNLSVQAFANVGNVYVANVTVGNAYTTFGNAIASAANILVVSAPGNATVKYYSHVNGTIIAKGNIVGSPTTYNFGFGLALSGDGSRLFVGEPLRSTGVKVYSYYTANVGANVNYSVAGTFPSTTLAAGTHYGSVIATNYTGNVIAVGAPLASGIAYASGNVYVYTRSGNTFTLSQTITGHYADLAGGFGSSIVMDDSGGNIFIGAPTSTISGYSNGLVERWVKSGASWSFKEAIFNPDEVVGSFGSTLGLSGDAQVLAIGSDGSPTEELTTFDSLRMIVDSNTTRFREFMSNSGAVYMYEPLTNLANIADVGTYSYTQELSQAIKGGDKFGSSISVARDIVLVGASGTTSNAGAAYVYYNPTKRAAWALTRQQQSKVDITNINRAFLYDKTNNVIQAALDFIDPIKGKVLNSVGVDIDFKLPYDPALYNDGSIARAKPDFHWGPKQVGKIWWNLNTVRFVDYEQDQLIYRLNNWGRIFPNSTVDVYEWVESPVPPSDYVARVGDGVPISTDNRYYCSQGYVTQSGSVALKYYFWVANKKTINVDAGKSNSVYSITAAIENPQAQGVPYMTVLSNNAVALYNVNNALKGKNTVLHLGTHNNKSGLIHTEYTLVQEGNPSSQIPTQIVNKLVDSLSGKDSVGNTVPDPALPPAQAYGIKFRPRQSMFIDRASALQNYILYVNRKLATYPTVERKLLTTLNSQEPVPSINTGLYSKVVETLVELDYIATTGIPNGYSVLIKNDPTQSGRWAIYAWNTSTKIWSVTRIQSYKTNLYWHYADWYQEGYDYTALPDITVDNLQEYGKLTLTGDIYVKVTNNGNNQFVVYYIDQNLNQNLVGIQNGTLQILTGTIPATELRQIVKAVQFDIFVDDLASYGNELFFTMVKYIMSEQKNLEWVFKTSFIGAKQYLRQLEQYPSYVADNQQYYLNYIEEVKPYRTVVREFVVDYQGLDQYGGDATDFDLPAYYDRSLGIYRSPNGTQAYDSTLVRSGKYKQWSDNFAYSVVDIIVEDPGIEYTSPPEIIISSTSGSGATAYATINATGGISEIVVTNGGSGYRTTPTVLINGVGSGAKAYAVLRNIYDGNNQGHNVVRSIRTKIKFDRVDYTNSNTFVKWSSLTANTRVPSDTILELNGQHYMFSIPTWSSNLSTVSGQMVYFGGNTYSIQGNIPLVPTRQWLSSVNFPVNTYLLWEGNTYISVGNTYANSFPYANANIISSDNNVVETYKFSNVLATGNLTTVLTNYHGYEVNLSSFPYENATLLSSESFSSANDRIVAYNGNVDLTVTQKGLEYPGVKLDGNTFVGNVPDSIVESFFSNEFGVSPSDVTIDGGKYIDIFNSFAPEELVPGYMRESMNMAVYDTTPLSFRIFSGLTEVPYAYRISSANVTTLTTELKSTDIDIVVANALILSKPSLIFNYPGTIFINGEKIYYWRNFSQETQTNWVSSLVVPTGTLIRYNSNAYVTTGNVFEPTGTFANIAANCRIINNINTLSQIRRGVDGTAVADVHPAGKAVLDAPIEELIPSSNVGNVILNANTTFHSTGIVTYVVSFTTPITANISESIVQVQTGTGNVLASMQVLQSVTNSRDVPVIVTSGNLDAVNQDPVLFDSGGPGNGFDMQGFDTAGETVLINGVQVQSFVSRLRVLGEVNVNGDVIVPKGTKLFTGNCWYTPGVNLPSNGFGLNNSGTEQANFLKQYGGISVPPGTRI